jgi:hypothetical protein
VKEDVQVHLKTNWTNLFFTLQAAQTAKKTKFGFEGF